MFISELVALLAGEPRGGRWLSRLIGSPIPSLTSCRRASCSPPSGLARCRCAQPRHPQQVVSTRHKVTPRLGSFYPPVAGAPQSAHCFHPAENFLHPLADAQASLTTLPARSTSVQARHLRPFLAGNMRGNLAL